VLREEQVDRGPIRIAALGIEQPRRPRMVPCAATLRQILVDRLAHDRVQKAKGSARGEDVDARQGICRDLRRAEVEAGK
jgi:hypothetical protein